MKVEETNDTREEKEGGESSGVGVKIEEGT